jgi:hypothetical protein
MKQYILLVIGLVAIGAWISDDLLARGGRGGGGFSGGGGHGGGGGGAHRSGGGGGRAGGGGGHHGAANIAGHTPTMSRPSGGSRPSIERPSGGRQSLGRLPTPGSNNVARPRAGNIARPGGGNIGRPGERPNAGDFANRPGRENRPGGNASRDQLDRFLEMGGGSRPSTRPGRNYAGAIAGGALAGGAAAQFLHEHPTQFPAGRPGAGDFAGDRMNRPGAGGGEQFRPGDRPGRPGGDNDNRPGRPGDNDRPFRPGDDNRPGRPGDNDRPFRPGDNDNRPGRPGDNIRPSRPGQGGSGERWNREDWAKYAHNHRPDRIPDRDRWNNWRHDNRNFVYNNWHNHWHDHDWHGHNWWNNNWWNRWGWRNPYYPRFNYWGWTAWPALTGWVNYGWQQPVYYNYGDNVYYDDGQVYYGDQPVASADEYAQQALAIALDQPATPPAPEDWMPLGVYAITTDGQPTDAEPSMYLQLAVSKQGVISGTFQNSDTDTAYQVEGMVDKETQRAAWVPKDKQFPVMETGMGNLTQDTTPALIHFADGTTQQWLMVRLDKPDDTTAPASR